MIEWINCPDCGKRLCKADIAPHNNERPDLTLYLWCKQCRKEVEIAVSPSNDKIQIEPETLAEFRNLLIEGPVIKKIRPKIK